MFSLKIFHNIDQCRRIVWPFEALRQKGGRISWDGWEPRAGMVGYVIHIWRPNHPNKMYRTPLNRDVYLIEIGKNYVPVTASGLRQYNQAMDSNQKEIETSRRNSLQREMTELRQQQVERGLTPILGSSLESPTSLTAEGGRNSSLATKSKIQAVSSSSSEDESCLLNLQKERQEEYLKNLWQQVIEQNLEDEIQNLTTTNIKQLLRELTNTDESETALDKNKTLQTVNKQTDNEVTAQHDNKEDPVLIKESSEDSGNVCTKELVDQLVDHVVDELCESVDNETEVVDKECLKKENHVNIIEIKAEDSTEIVEEVDADTGEICIVYNI